MKDAQHTFHDCCHYIDHAYGTSVYSGPLTPGSTTRSTRTNTPREEQATEATAPAHAAPPSEASTANNGLPRSRSPSIERTNKPYNVITWMRTLDTHRHMVTQTGGPELVPPPLPAGPCDYSVSRSSFTGCTGVAEQWVQFSKHHRRLCSICANGAMIQKLGIPPALDPTSVTVPNPWLHIPGLVTTTQIATTSHGGTSTRALTQQPPVEASDQGGASSGPDYPISAVLHAGETEPTTGLLSGAGYRPHPPLCNRAGSRWGKAPFQCHC
jgi:hypothetical protein